VAKQKLSREARLDLLVKLVKGKGSAAVGEIKKRIDAGQELTAKGITWDVGMLREALVRTGVNATSRANPATGQTATCQVSTSVRAPLSTTKAPVAPATPAAPTVTSSVSSLASANGTTLPRPHPTLPRPQPTPAASTGSSSRWSVGPPTAEAIARKAQLESEQAETFIHTAKNLGENKVAVLMKPNVQSQPTGEYVMPGESFEVVARLSRVQDGRTYLRLKKSTGWVCTRSRKDYWRVVVGSHKEGTVLEPDGFATVFHSHAVRVLQRVDDEGSLLDEHGKPLQAGDSSNPLEAKKFRVVGGRSLPILGTPDLQSSQMGAMLQAKEDFSADAVCVAASDGRTYVRLQDGFFYRYRLSWVARISWHLILRCVSRAAPRGAV